MNIQLDPDALRPLIRTIVAETLAVLEKSQAAVSPDRLAYSEAEGAALLGLQPHQLRDERLRGRISASAVVGKRIRYRREDLVKYLADRRVDA